MTFIYNYRMKRSPINSGSREDNMIRRLYFFLLLGFLTTALAWAESEKDDYARIARISYIEGNVSFQHAGDVDWSALSINVPLQPGDRIYTGKGGRAEIEFDEGSILRLAEETDIEVLSSKEDIIQLRILAGLSTLNAASDVDFEVDTPAAAFNTLLKGVYRFEVRENGDSEAIVRKGLMEIANNHFTKRIDSGERFTVSPGDTNPREIARYIQRDAWDEWNDRRNADVRAYASRRYLPDTVTVGVSDLDRHGYWINVSSYGPAWVPHHVDEHWSPYSVGRWCYRPHWGWTWVSYEPWGWLPYHYGRWYYYVGTGWCWLPGPSFAFSFWSPGLVAFYYGPTWVSWCPLGPGDYYDIHNYYYHRGRYDHYLGQLNRLHTRHAGDLYNRNVHNAFRTVAVHQFTNEGFRDGYRHVSVNVDRPWSQGRFAHERLSIQPTARSFSPDPDRPSIRPREINNRPVIVRSDPGSRNANNRGFTRINNPNIPSRPSMQPRGPSEPRAGEMRGEENRSPARIYQSPRAIPRSAPENRDANKIAPDRSEERREPPQRRDNWVPHRNTNSGERGNTSGQQPQNSNPARENREYRAPAKPQSQENSTAGERREGYRAPSRQQPENTSPARENREYSAPSRPQPQNSTPAGERREYSAPPRQQGAPEAPERKIESERPKARVESSSNFGFRRSDDSGNSRSFGFSRQASPSAGVERGSSGRAYTPAPSPGYRSEMNSGSFRSAPSSSGRGETPHFSGSRGSAHRRDR
jgi:hypothetical protein